MARRRRDRDSDSSRDGSGGVRQSEFTRRVSQSIRSVSRYTDAFDPLERIGGSFRSPDWSDYRIDDNQYETTRSSSSILDEPRPGIGRLEDAARATRLASFAERDVKRPSLSARPMAGVSTSRAAPLASRVSKLSLEAKRPLAASAGASKRPAKTLSRGTEARKPDHSPRNESPNEAREERARANCKPRPEDNKTPERTRHGRGGSSSKDFVPWCDRERRR